MVQEQLRRILQYIAKKENYVSAQIDIKPTSSEGANYTSDLYLATISEPPKPDIHIFSKAAILHKNGRTQKKCLPMYKVEVFFYCEMAVGFETIYNKYKVAVEDRLVIPKYYAHELIPNQEILVLENLNKRGFISFDRMTTFDWKYAAAAVTQLAKLHAVGILYCKEYPVEFEKASNNFIVDFTKDRNKMLSYLRDSIKNASPGLSDDYKQRLTNFLYSKKSVENAKLPMMEDKLMLLHGDFKPSNLMHREKNGQVEVIVMDYQGIRLGNPVEDLIYFIFTGSNGEFRRLHYKQIFDHYFTQLTLALQHLKIDVEDVFPRTYFETSLKKSKTLSLMLGVIMAGVTTVAAEDAPELDGDVFVKAIKLNQHAIERISELVYDFIHWGVL